MNDSYQDAIKEAFVIAPSGKVIIHTLEIRQTGAQDPIYLARCRDAIAAVDENDVTKVYEPVGFNFTLPGSTEEGFRSLNLSVDNIEQRATDFVKTAKTYKRIPVECVYRPYLSDDLSTPQLNPPLILFLKDIRINEIAVTARATFKDIINTKFPSTLYTRDRYPGL